MGQTTTHLQLPPVSLAADRQRGWPVRVVYAAGAWSALYGLLSLYWMLGGAGFPFGVEHDPMAQNLSALAALTPASGAPVIFVGGLLGVLVAWQIARFALARLGWLLRLGFAWLLGLLLLFVATDYRVLVAIAYTPILLLGAPFNWPPGVTFSQVVPWPVLNQFICLGGAFLWFATAVTYQRQVRNACLYCGRTGHTSNLTAPAAAARWGRWAVYVAVVVPLLYAATRYAWALGIPLGITAEFWRQGQAVGLWYAGAILATLAVGGAILTVGLIQPWGERFPRWMFGLAGKRVPIRLATAPALLVTAIVSETGLMEVRLAFTTPFDWRNWAGVAAELLWPIWGLALGAATLAYYYRRRGVCKRCGRG